MDRSSGWNGLAFRLALALAGFPCFCLHVQRLSFGQLHLCVCVCVGGSVGRLVVDIVLLFFFFFFFPFFPPS